MFKLIFIVFSIIQVSQSGAKNIGRICVTGAISKAPPVAGWKKRQFIQVDNFKKVSFENIPKIAFDNLSTKKKYLVKVFWDEHQLASWWQEFDEKKPMIQVYFRPGYWRAEAHGPEVKCIDLPTYHSG
jgi:hypothetical protein